MSGQITSKLIEKMSLMSMRVASDPTNYRILTSLPTKIELLMETTGLTKVPVNQRVNKLERAGLLKRYRGTGLLVDTEYGLFFKEKINVFENEAIRPKVIEAVKRLIK